jgi:hypothetical protein
MISVALFANEALQSDNANGVPDHRENLEPLNVY